MYIYIFEYMYFIASAPIPSPRAQFAPVTRRPSCNANILDMVEWFYNFVYSPDGVLERGRIVGGWPDCIGCDSQRVAYIFKNCLYDGARVCLGYLLSCFYVQSVGYRHKIQNC